MSEQNPAVPFEPTPEPALPVEVPPASLPAPAVPAAPAASMPPPPPAAPAIQAYPNGKPMLTATGRPASPKSRLAAALLAFFFGYLGVHRFYVGKIGTGILMLITLGFFGIWTFIDFIWILVGSFKDKQERVLSNW